MSNAIAALSPHQSNNRMIAFAAAVGGLLVLAGGKLANISWLNVPGSKICFSAVTGYLAVKGAQNLYQGYDAWSKDNAFLNNTRLHTAIAAGLIAGLVLASGTVSAINSKLPEMVHYSVDKDFGTAFVASALLAGLKAYFG